jgi:arginine N-succinyltransferase
VFLIRRAKIEDVPTLLKLARMVHFINLPADKDIITEKVMRSRESFIKAAGVGDDSGGDGAGHDDQGRSRVEAGAAAEETPGRTATVGSGGGQAGAGDGLASLIRSSDQFMFVIEDVSPGGGGVLGTSQIISKMGGPGQANVSFKLSRKEMFSTSLQIGATHILAKLVLDESGPTEIGGLILQPSYRGHRLRLGRFLSLVRFHVMGMFRSLFSAKVIAEMMGPMMADGQNTLWEYLGRRFINLTYNEADRFCQYSKEFMFTLLPREEIYLTLLPPEARAVIGQVGPETAPARRMLEKLGFRYLDHIDPFDGGPHLEAATDEITLVKDTQRAILGPPAAGVKSATHGFVSVIDGDGEFRAIEADYELDRQGRLRLSQAQLDVLGAEPGVSAGCTPLGGRPSDREQPSNGVQATPRPRKRRASSKPQD